jgi:lipopolysaccharide export LptBFGC system permease protein LptF
MVDSRARPVGARRREGEVLLRRSRGLPLPYYLRSFVGSVVRLVVIAMALVEAIFLAERFPMVFRDVINNNASLLDAILMFACSRTQIFDLALPIAILVAVYLTTIRMRESRELLVFATAGIGPFHLMGLTLIIGLAALALSLLVSGVIDPGARYAQRVILFDAEFRALKEGINTGQFHYFSNKVTFAPARSATVDGRAGGGQSRNLFVYQEVRPGSFRVITADTVRLDGPFASGLVRLRLGGFSSSVFSVPPPRTARPPASTPCSPCSDAGNGALSAGDVVQELKLDELLPFPPRGSDLKELTLLDQLRQQTSLAPGQRRTEMRLLGERFARGLLCLLAPLIALVSVCATSRATNHAVLPLACLALMDLNISSAWLIRIVAPTEWLWAICVPIVVSTALAVPLLLSITRSQGDIIRPQLSRA